MYLQPSSARHLPLLLHSPPPYSHHHLHTADFTNYFDLLPTLWQFSAIGYLPPKPLALCPQAPLDGHQYDLALTHQMPVEPKHARANTNPSLGVPAATATAKHGSLITPPPAHGADTLCTPLVHSLKCPLPLVLSVILSHLTSTTYNQHEACPHR